MVPKIRGFMEKELKIEVAKSKCINVPVDKEFEELLQTKRENFVAKNSDINFSENSKY